MPAPEKIDNRARLLTYARWGAIGLASLSALMIAVFSGTGALRVAAFFAVVAVVLVILSITLNGAASQKAHLEETLLEEIDMLREDVRADITTAARATHRALAERVAHLHQSVDQMRREIDVRPIGEAPPPGQPPLAPPPGRRALPGPMGPVVHTETVQVTTRYVDQPEEMYPPRQAPRPRPDERYDRMPPRQDDRFPPRPDGRDPAGGGRGPRRREEWRDERDDGGPFPPPASYPPQAPYSSAAPYPSGAPYSPGALSGPPEEAWSAPRRSFVTPMPALDDEAEIAAWRSGRPMGRDDDPVEDPRWSGMQAGDRWAEVRTDERGGRELRMGERRTAIHTDETGTQMRIVDRWSSVREEPAYPDDGYGPAAQGETRSERRRREEAEQVERRAEEDWRLGRSERAEAPRALPASGPEPAAGWVRGGGERVDARAEGWSDPRAARPGPHGPQRRPSPGPRSRREISGEIVPDRGDDRRDRRDDPRDDRREDRAGWPGGRGGQPQPGGYDERGRDAYDPRGRDAYDPRGRDDTRARDGRDDGRWERESSGGRAGIRRNLDFDHTDERWR